MAKKKISKKKKILKIKNKEVKKQSVKKIKKEKEIEKNKIQSKKRGKKSKKMKGLKKKSNKKFIVSHYDQLDQLEDGEIIGLDNLDYLMYENDLDKLPHDKFDTYDIPETVEDNEEYLKKLINESDVILELLDARDINYFRDKEIEKSLINDEHKLLIYIITKADLVSNDYINKIAIKLSEESENKIPVIITSALSREKINNLYQKIKQLIHQFKLNNNTNKTPKRRNELVKIGIIGMPNVGKNSLIRSFELIVNSNCDDKYINFEDNKMFCINSIPGIIYGKDNEQSQLISKKYKIIEDIPNPLSLLTNLLNFIDKNKIKDIYNLTKRPENIEDLISLLKKKFAMKSDKLVGYQILKDIINGKIVYEVDY